MDRIVRNADLFQGLPERGIDLVATVARRESFAAGDYLFRVGDQADRLYVVVTGAVELCQPVMLGEGVRDLPLERVTPGKTFGWSALVKPYRFTLSARANTDCEVVSLLSEDLVALFEGEPRTGYVLQTRVSELIGLRLLKVQAMWARELQRTLDRRAPSGGAGG